MKVVFWAGSVQHVEICAQRFAALFSRWCNASKLFCVVVLCAVVKWELPHNLLWCLVTLFHVFSYEFHFNNSCSVWTSPTPSLAKTEWIKTVVTFDVNLYWLLMLLLLITQLASCVKTRPQHSINTSPHRTSLLFLFTLVLWVIGMLCLAVLRGFICLEFYRHLHLLAIPACYYPPSHVNVMLSNMTFLMNFAVFDPSPLTLWINCSF